MIGGTRPYHTLIPGMLTRDGALVGPFGLMGGMIQAQSHTQFLCELMRGETVPATRRPRSIAGASGSTAARSCLEAPLWDRGGELADLGFEVRRTAARAQFGGGQAIIVRDGTLFGGSDARKDGCALGILGDHPSRVMPSPRCAVGISRQQREYLRARTNRSEQT